MANKRITDVDYINSLTSDESFFVNQNNSIKQINKNNIVFDIVNGGTGADNASDARDNLGLGSVATENVLPITKGGTGASSASAALVNFGITATASELNYCDGVTSDIQTQLDKKSENGHTHSIKDVRELYDKLYDATVSRKANTFLAAPNGANGVGEFRKIVSDDLPTITVAKGGTGATDGATALKNLFAAGATVLSDNQFGTSLPTAGINGRIFFKKVNN